MDHHSKGGPLPILWCCFLWRTRFISCTYDFPHRGRDVVQQAHLLRSRSRQWMDGCFHFHLGSDIQRKSSVTAHTSICNTESSDFANNLSVKKKNLPEDALDRNMTQFNIGTAMHSGSEHRKTGRVVLSF